MTILNVDKSVNLSRWVLPETEMDLIEKIARQNDVPEFVARLLAGRGIAPEEADTFLNPKLARDFPDPRVMVSMDEAASWLADALEQGRKIGVFGDFDVDGATSTAILVRFFRHLGLDVPFYIPDRLKEGYGPNVGALQSLKEQGAEIVLMCDCGTTAFDVIEQGTALGLEIIILDHHEAEERLPVAKYVINPKRKDDTSGLNMLAACGVTFMLCVALNTKLRESGYYEKRGIEEAPLKKLLDLVALGTVCDMVPLTGVNRLLVRSGFEQMARYENAGIKALCEVSGVKEAPNPYHAGFMIGPRINAGSRVHKAWLGAKILCSDDPEEARNIAFTLNDCNELRKEIEQQMLDQAFAMIEEQGLAENPVIIAGHEDWHPGLSGLVAGRIKERYNRPACVITFAENQEGVMEGRGSGRSVPGINMGAAFIDARNDGLLVKGGGHAMAGGFTVLRERLNDFSAFLTRHIERQAQGMESVSDMPVDAMLSVHGARPDFVRLIHEKVGPFGSEFQEPVFVLPQVRLQQADVVGAGHIRMFVSDWEGGSRMKAMAFRAEGTPLGDLLLGQGRDIPLHLAGHLKVDSWNGRENVEMHVQDAALCSSQTD